MDLSQVRIVSHWYIPDEDDYFGVDEAGESLSNIRIPYKCLSCATLLLHVAKSKLCGLVALLQFWDRVLTSRSLKVDYGIAGSTKPLMLILTDGAGFMMLPLQCYQLEIPTTLKLFSYFYKCQRSGKGLPSHFQKIQGVSYICNDLLMMVQAWRDNLQKVELARGTVFWRVGLIGGASTLGQPPQTRRKVNKLTRVFPPAPYGSTLMVVPFVQLAWKATAFPFSSIVSKGGGDSSPVEEIGHIFEEETSLQKV
ncbi:uncharacterized protein G2W53_033931 [Senna tora]|uniref:Uncharacterized protein n=1 Tax=Senna tora TaxID=362788 RepID=A0A834T1L2_9FABA|nr:uncharacterized protein G2W53_033931 [Senna tora]